MATKPMQIFARQAGVAAQSQLLAAGVAAGLIRSRIQKGEWELVHPGVYRLTGVPLSPEARVRAATLWAGAGSAIAGAAAAWWWELTEDCPRRIDVVITRNRHLRPTRDVRVVRPRSRPAETTYRRLRVVTLAHAAVFGAAALGGEGQAVLDRALQRRITVEAAVNVLAAHPHSPGSALARRWLAAAADQSASELERLFLRIMADARIGPWEVNRDVISVAGQARPDCRLRGTRLLVELDGWAFHSSPESFARDRQRQNALVSAGWLVLRFTWRDLTERHDQVVAEVRAALRRVA